MTQIIVVENWKLVTIWQSYGEEEEKKKMKVYLPEFKTLVEKTVDFNDRDFLVRNLFNPICFNLFSYWTHSYIHIITAFLFLNIILRPFSDYYHV